MAEAAGLRKPILWVMSYSRLSRLVESLIPEYEAGAEIRIANRRFEAALRCAEELLRRGEADAFVSAGANGAFLRRGLTHPVAIIKVTGFDIMRALARAARISRRAAIVTYEQIPPELDEFRRLFDLDIELRRYTTEDDVRSQVEALAAAGCEVVVGPSLVCDIAEERGMTGVFLYSQSSVRQALDDAVESVRLARIEEARRERLNAILRHLRDGVVAVDTEERIESFNPALERLLGIEAGQALGRRLSEVVPALGLKNTLASGSGEAERVQRLGAATLVTARIPLVEHGVVTGAVLTCQDAGAIQRADRRLRTHARPRQFTARYRLDDLTGDSRAMQELRALARRYARTDSTLLIGGESGTGKEVLAQGVHNAGPRRGQPFVAINCAAFPENLLESELFGYEEGAFTGSRRGGKPGLFEAAHTGTMFLDEIGDMPLALQTRLLRVLQEREVLRLGSFEPTPIDVRVIAATHRDLGEAVARGGFRTDLYYRLNILQLRLPPLRERREDVPAIAARLLDAVLARLSTRERAGDLLAEFLRHAQGYDWPGNVRELENMLERFAVWRTDRESAAELPRVLPELAGGAKPPPARAPGLLEAERARELERIRRVLAECGGSRVGAARRLGISRSTLWRRLNGG